MKPKVCLITGSNGFIGSHLAQDLENKGIEVLKIGRDSDRSSSDITNRENIRNAFSSDFGTIYHLAAKTTIPESWSDTTSYFSANVTGTFNLLEELKSHRSSDSIPFVFVSSSAVYGTRYDSAIKENFELHPVNPYGMTKACAETLCKGYFNAFGIQAKIVRPFYVTGPGTLHGIVAEVARTIALGESNKAAPIIKLGSTNSVVDVVDVRDCVAAMEIIASKGASTRAYNISSGTGHTVGEIVEILISKSKIGFKIEYDEKKVRTQDHRVLIGDPSNVIQLGWARKFSLEDSLQSALDYYRLVENGRLKTKF